MHMRTYSKDNPLYRKAKVVKTALAFFLIAIFQFETTPMPSPKARAMDRPPLKFNQKVMRLTPIT